MGWEAKQASVPPTRLKCFVTKLLDDQFDEQENIKLLWHDSHTQAILE